MKGIISVLLLTCLFISGCRKEFEYMAIEFTEANQQQIDFGSVEDLPGFPWEDGTDLGSVVVIFHINSFQVIAPAVSEIWAVQENSDAGGWNMIFLTDNYWGTDDLAMTYLGWDGVTPNNTWRTPNSSISTGQVYVAIITYDRSNIANDPVIYLNGVSQVLTQESTATGNPLPSTTADFLLGGDSYFSDRYAIDGNVYYFAGFRDRILTAEEARSITAQRNADGFNPTFELRLHGASGIKDFGGATLGESNLITEFINGYKGTPYVSPKGYADDFTHVR